MNLTYKENVPDTRETPVRGIIKELKEYGVDIYGYDPLLDDIEHEFDIKAYDSRLLTNSTNSTNPTNSTNQLDAIILAVAHDAFKVITLDNLKAIMNNDPILIDVRGIFNAEQAKEAGFYYETL